MYIVVDYMIPMKGMNALSAKPVPEYSNEIQCYMYDYWYEFSQSMQISYTRSVEKVNEYNTLEEAEAFLERCKNSIIYTDGLKIITTA